MTTLDLLNEIAEFLEGQSDVVDGSYGEPHANRAMSLLGEVNLQIEQLRRQGEHPDLEILREIAVSGVSHESRGYVEVQINRAVWNTLAPYRSSATERSP